MSEKDPAEDQGADRKKQFKNIKSDELFDEIDEYFDVFDRDKDGQIIDSELISLLRWLGFNPTETDMKNLCATVDEGGTGFFKQRQVY